VRKLAKDFEELSLVRDLSGWSRDQSDDSQTNAHHGGGHCENVDTDILLQMRARVAVPVRFSFHGDQLLDRPRNRLFRQ
jgi:hypothetical protein